MSYFRTCVLLCQEENPRIKNMQYHPLVTSIKLRMDTKTFQIDWATLPGLPVQHPTVPQSVHFQIGRCA